MIENFALMLWPMLASFVLVGIHAYLGIHVIARKVIFVDLALAQIAALGAVYGLALGFSYDDNWLIIKASAISFTLVAAALFSFTRSINDHIPHEVIIGVIYACALSLTLIMTANLPHGSEAITQLLSGNILWTNKEEVIVTALLYIVIGILHFIFRKPFGLLSFSSSSPKISRLWDFLFYASFGIVVTSSVSMGGILLVFAYLVIPAVLGVMLGQSILSRLLYAWSLGIIVSFIGILSSFYLDWPSGPVIVVELSLSLIIISLYKSYKRNPKVLFDITIIVTMLIAAIIWPLILSFK